MLCRRIIDRKWFPSFFRTGFAAWRSDCHSLLEQWIPFDVSNMAKQESGMQSQKDLVNGRLAIGDSPRTIGQSTSRVTTTIRFLVIADVGFGALNIINRVGSLT
jgi:hypothetical protein